MRIFRVIHHRINTNGLHLIIHDRYFKDGRAAKDYVTNFLFNHPNRHVYSLSVDTHMTED